MHKTFKRSVLLAGLLSMVAFNAFAGVPPWALPQSVPEIDAGYGLSALSLLAGYLALAHEKKRNK